jgi:hypothetical protein
VGVSGALRYTRNLLTKRLPQPETVLVPESVNRDHPPGPDVDATLKGGTPSPIAPQRSSPGRGHHLL